MKRGNMNKNFSILVVDDDEAKRYSLARLLQHEGFVVSEVGTGQEALDSVVTLQPDLVILDVNLPDISGLEVCRRIKSSILTSHIPVLHLSATHVSLHHRIEGLDNGADAYLTDVVHGPELIATARALLRARQAERALRESEARFELLVRGVRDYAVFTCNSKGQIDSWNEGVERLLGYPRDQFVGRDYHSLLPFSDDAPFDLAKLHDSRRVEFECWLVRPDQSRFAAIVSLTAVFNEQDKLVGLVTIIRDVTERKAVEEERARLLAAERVARDDAVTANRLKDEFLATLSHELRTPLTAILGWSQLLKMAPTNRDEVVEAADVIERNARSQAQLIDDLLDVSRIISGKLRLNVSRLRIDSVIEAAIQSLQTTAEEKRITVVRETEGGPTFVNGDAARLQQIVWNLLSNAIKFTAEGGRVAIESQRADDHIDVAVVDDGEGIAPDFLPYVFDRFRQADGSTRRSHGGLGLGLAIVKQLAELHGGSVRVESEGLGRGARFIIRLPLDAASEPSGEAASAPLFADEAAAAAALPNLSGMHVLIVEDDADSRHLLHRLLSGGGARVVSAASVPEGVAAFEKHRPDVVVSDIGMSGEDGYSLIRRIRNLEAIDAPPIPAIALSAFARPEDHQRSLAAGFNVHIVKPVLPAELLTMVATLVKGSGKAASETKTVTS